MNTILLGTLVALLPAAADVPEDATITASKPVREQNVFVLSALGPGAGKTAIGVGGRALVVVPMLDLHVVHGFTDRLDLEARVATIGFLSFADVGLRYRFFGDESFSLAARANAHAIGVFAIVGGGFSSGPAAGLVASFGDEDWQLSLSEDIPIHLVQGIAVNGKEGSGNYTAVVSRSTISYEVMVAKETSLYVSAQLYMPIIKGQAGVMPFLAIGASF